MIWSCDVFERLGADMWGVRGRTGDENDQNVSWNFQIFDKHITIKGKWYINTYIITTKLSNHIADGKMKWFEFF